MSRHTHIAFLSLSEWKHTLTDTLNRELAKRRVATALGEFRAVPHQKLLARLKRFDGVEVDVQTVLARHKVLLLHRASRVDKSHPVAPLLIQTIQDVVQMSLQEHLQSEVMR